MSDGGAQDGERSKQNKDRVEQFIEYQQNEIDGAQEDIGTRLDHIASGVKHGLLEGECVNNHENKTLKAYLQGYADALEYSAERVECIENYVKYVADEVPEGEA